MRFLELIAENVETHHIRLYAYVLVSNHYHLLCETPRANLAAFMQQLNSGYTIYSKPLDVAMRRTEVPPSPERILAVVEEESGVPAAELRKRRSASDVRMPAMKLLNEAGGLSQREVAVQLGLRNGSGVSRRLSELTRRMKRGKELQRDYRRLCRLLTLNH